MKNRCTRPSYKYWKNYGGRGITYCKEWEDFEAFQQWALANGYDEHAPRGKCTLDRIDNNGNYEPSNCRWVDGHTQNMNSSKHFNRNNTDIRPYLERIDRKEIKVEDAMKELKMSSSVWYRLKKEIMEGDAEK